MADSSVYAVILAGGQSSRLFPFNKVLSDLTGKGRSLIRQAKDRLSMLAPDHVMVLTVDSMVKAIRQELKLPQRQIFSDPVRRGTWPALLWALAHLRKEDAEAVVAVVTADHVIGRTAEFQKAFHQAVERAKAQPAFVVIPVRPSKKQQEWVGFGAVRAAGFKHAKEGSLHITGFEEKPTLVRAAQMIQEGGWAWNAGMFFFRIDAAEKLLEIYHPDMAATYQRLIKAVAQGKSKEAKALFAAFPEKIPHILDPQRQVDNTVDYAIMMPLVHRPTPSACAWMTRQALTAWTDLGQWTALRQVIRPDRQGNVCIGDVRLGKNVSQSIIVAQKGHRIVVNDAQGLIVAAANGRTLVLPEKDVSDVKMLVLHQAVKRRIIGPPSVTSAFTLSKQGGRLVLSNRTR